jgi:hypothetical protein
MWCPPQYVSSEPGRTFELKPGIFCFGFSVCKKIILHAERKPIAKTRTPPSRFAQQADIEREKSRVELESLSGAAKFLAANREQRREAEKRI